MNIKFPFILHLPVTSSSKNCAIQTTYVCGHLWREKLAVAHLGQQWPHLVYMSVLLIQMLLSLTATKSYDIS